MKIEQQVCTLEQAQKLRILGIEQESVFYFLEWMASDFTGTYIVQRCNKGFFHSIDGEVETLDGPRSFSAFTASELGAMLPTLGIEAQFFNDGNGTDLWEIKCHKSGSFKRGLNLSILFADLLIYLLQFEFTNAEDCNKRLSA